MKLLGEGSKDSSSKLVSATSSVQLRAQLNPAVLRTRLWGLGISSLSHFTCNLQIWISDGNKSSSSTQGDNIFVVMLIPRGKQEGHMLMYTFLNVLFHGQASEWICGTCIHALPSFNHDAVA